MKADQQTTKILQIQKLMTDKYALQIMQFVLFGFRAHLTLHLERSLLSHSLSYDPARDRPSCFASYTLNPESFAQYAG